MFKTLDRKDLESLYENVVTMNWRKVGYLNPRVAEAFRKVHPGVFSHVVVGALDEHGAEAGITGAEKTEKGAVPVRFGKSGNTMQISLTALVDTYPSLKTPKGRVRVFPVSFRSEGDTNCLVLDLMETKLVVPENKGKRKQQEGDAPAQAPAAPAKPPAPAEAGTAGKKESDRKSEKGPNEDVAAGSQQ